jgi:hypothetical protein
MKKYIVIYTAPRSVSETVHQDPEMAKEVMAKWGEWMQKIGSGMVDMGTPLGDAVTVTKDGAKPLETKIVGYSILQAESLDEAKKLVEGHPHLDMPGGCGIEIHEALPVPGM